MESAWKTQETQWKTLKHHGFSGNIMEQSLKNHRNSRKHNGNILEKSCDFPET